MSLSRYAGRQWSVFYQPDGRVWELILGVTIRQGQASRAIWGRPRIETDRRAARQYLDAPRP